MKIKRNGFTIVEMLMVIGVLAVLTAIVTTAASSAVRQARTRRIEAMRMMVQTGIATYRAQRGHW
ncbi:MAG: prepilin-type N-terminal cleavage/methylation domain-containing protein, partial [Oscillospiraceae bacterium]|nr:prepilin-type N-terminal cleavage/methylation domain-containing protein [Oscillospiraceae bacterium]